SRVNTVQRYRVGIWMRYLWGDIAATLAAVQQRGRPGVTPPVRALCAFCTAFFCMRYDYVDWRDPLPVWTAIMGRACGGIKRIAALFLLKKTLRNASSNRVEQQIRKAEAPHV